MGRSPTGGGVIMTTAAGQQWGGGRTQLFPSCTTPTLSAPREQGCWFVTQGTSGTRATRLARGPPRWWSACAGREGDGWGCHMGHVGVGQEEKGVVKQWRRWQQQWGNHHWQQQWGGGQWGALFFANPWRGGTLRWWDSLQQIVNWKICARGRNTQTMANSSSGWVRMVLCNANW